MPFPILPSNGPSGYNLTKSIRLRASATGYLNRTPATAGNQKTWTYSTWIKRGNVAAEGTIISGGATTGRLCVFFNSSGQLISDVGGTGTYDQSTAVYRDPSAWYHFVWQFDTTQATAANRSRMYINGVQVSLTNTRTFTQNADYQINNSVLQTLGTFSNSIGTYNFDGYQTEINFIDGQALTPSSFGSTNALTGVWQPAKYTGTYGTNGFYLPFTDTTSTTTLGYDFSGNGNNWTTNNISLTAGTTYDSMNDVPTLTSATTANYCVLNPVDKDPDITMSNGNLTATAATGVHNNARTTMGCGTTGYWYMEFTYTGSIGGSTAIAVGLYDPAFRIDNGTHPVTTGDGFYGLYASAGAPYMYTDGGNPSVAVNGGSAGDILQLAYDVAGGKLWFGLNNVWYDSSGGTTGNPSTGANATITTVATNRIFGFDIVSNTINFNFGQRPFTYTPPTGYVALNTYNLPTSTIVKGNTVMDATLYTGNDTAGTNIVNTGGFLPDFVWIKNRSTASQHVLTDSVRGVTKQLFSSLTNAEQTSSTGITSLNSNGFTLGTNVSPTGSTNSSPDAYVGWQWQAGQGTTSTNTAGSITSTVSVNASAGFSVVTYTGTGTAGTIGHGLGVAPTMIIVKIRNSGGVYDWYVYHASLGNTSVLYLNAISSAGTGSSLWNSTTPTSSVFSVGNSTQATNITGGTFVAYCWAEIAGFSKFTTYVGNASTDGPFVYCGFRPKFIMTKASSTGSIWGMWDSSRNTYNAAGNVLQAQASDAEISPYNIDILSNGFKMRDTNSNWNGSGQTFIVMAFAENPFKNALAR